MKNHPSNTKEPVRHLISHQLAINLVCLTAIILGGLVLLGCLFDLPVKSFLPAADNMVANAALGFIIAGFGLWYATNRTALKNPEFARLASLCFAVGLFVLGLATMSEHLFGLDLGIDELFVPGEHDLNSVTRSRMAPMSALSFILLSLILAIHQWQPRFEKLLKEILAAILLGVSGLALMGHIFDPETLYQVSAYSHMALLTGLLFILVALGVLLDTFPFSQKALGYGLTLMAVALAIYLYLLTADWFGYKLPPFVSFYSIIILANLLAGVGTGLLAFVLTVFVVAIWFYEPVGYLAIDSPVQQLGLLLFIINGLLINFVIYLYHRHRRKAMLLERQLTGAALRESEDRLLLFVEYAPAGIAMFDREMRYIAASRRWRVDYGLADEVKGQSHYALFPEIPGRWKDVHRRGLAGEVVTAEEDAFTRADGSVQWLKWEVRPWYLTNGAVGGILIGAEDITARKQTENALAASERRFRAIFNHQFQYTALLRLDERIVEVSDSVTLGTGITPAEVIGMPFLDAPWWRDLPESCAQWRRLFKEAMSRPGPSRDEASYHTKDGTLRHALNTVTALRDEQGQVEYLLVEGIDITERKLAEEALRSERTKLAEVLDNLPVGVWITDETGRVITKNKIADRIWAGDTPLSKGPEDYLEYPAWNAETGRRLETEDYPLMKTLLTKRPIAPVELRIRRFNGEEGFILMSTAPLWDERGQLNGAIGINIDITASKRIEAALYESEKRLRLAQESAQVGVWDWILDSGKVQWTPELECLYGYEPGTFAGNYSGFSTRVHPDDLPEVERIRDAAISAHEPFDFDFRICLPTGAVRWVNCKGAAVYNAAGKPERVLGVNVDITERRQAMEKLQRSEERFRLLHEGMRDAFVQTNMDGLILDCNEQYCQLLGYTRSELQTKTYLDLTPSRWHALEADIVGTQILPLGYSGVYEKEYRRKDGTIVPIELRTILVRDAKGRPESMWATIRDISERKAAESALRESEYRFRQVAESLPQLVWTCMPNGPCNYLGPQWLNYTGKSESEQLGYGWLEQVHPEDRQNAIDQWQQCANSGNQFKIEFRIRRYDGVYRWFRTLAVPLRNEAGEIIKWFGSNTDIDDSKIAELSLRESRHQLTMALEAGQLGFWDWDVPSGRVQFGGRWAAMLGYDLSDIEPDVRSWENLVHPDEKAAIMAVLADHLEGRTELYECEHRMRHKDGSWRWILDRGQVVERDAEGRPLRAIGIHADVTVRHEAECALQEADRQKNEFLAMLGHELRNPLTPINNVAQLLVSMPLNATTIAKASEILTRNVGHMTRMIDDLLDVSRITRGVVAIDRHPIELGKLLKDTAESVQSFFIDKRQTLELHLPSRPIRVDGDPIRLTQVFSNLLMNATKYTNEAGHIDLSVNLEGQSIAVRIQDNGSGIEPQLLPHVFELFTQGKRSLARSEGGLGIGLTLVKKLVELHGGKIKASSQGINQGSEFEVMLPVLQGDSTEAESELPKKQNELGAEGLRMLMIDDNEDVLDSISLWLEMGGHQVRTANNGTQGIAIAQSFMPDIILLDIGLPDMDGYQVAKKLRELPTCEGVRIVAMSGYSSGQFSSGKDETGFDLYLLKPPELNQLQNLITECQRAKQAMNDSPSSV